MGRGRARLAPVVLDPSVALAWLVERPLAAERAAALAVLRGLAARPALVPALWHAEIVNALAVGERRGRLAEGHVLEFLDKLSALPIETDTGHGPRWWAEVRALARRHGLSAYDAAYLELALRERAELATFDRALARAAREAGGRLACPGAGGPTDQE